MSPNAGISTIFPYFPAKSCSIMPNIKFTFKFFLVATGLFFLCVCSNTTVLAQGNLMVFPKRLVFEGPVKTAQLTLANIGRDTARYNISFVQYKMNEDGSFIEIKAPEPGQNFADGFLRYYPRSVLLAPKESQIIKIQLNKTNLLTNGEYRSHIYFRAVLNSKPLGDEEKKDTAKLSIQLIPIFGITIPVIIRVGEPDAKVTLSDISLSMQNDTIPVVQVKLNRTGKMSVYGDISINHISPTGKSTSVGKASGIAVYTPNPTRLFRLPITNSPAINYHSGTLHIEYLAPTDAKAEKYAETDYPLK